MSKSPKITKAYHGSNNSTIFARNIFDRKGNDEHGPGLYLVNDPRIAKNYGKLLYEIVFDETGFITQKSRVDVVKINKIILENISEEILSDWHEDSLKAISLLKKSVFSGKTYIDIILNLWQDVFNLNNKKTIEALIKNHINGIIVKITKDITYYIIYNPLSIINFSIL